MLRVKNIAFSYPKRDPTLKGVSFEADGGHCLALMGGNGAGKSTLLNCLNGIIKPSAGEIYIDGMRVDKLSRSEMAKQMSYAEQHSEVTQLTVYDTVLLGRKPYIQMSPTQKDYDIVKNSLERLGLERFALRYLSELSGGEFQKVVIARALAQQTKIMLLDEPTSNLDIYNQHEVMEIVSEIARTDNILAVVVIHDLNLALRYCDRFLFLKDGFISCMGDSTVVTPELLREIYNVDADVADICGKRTVVINSIDKKDQTYE